MRGRSLAVAGVVLAAVAAAGCGGSSSGSAPAPGGGPGAAEVSPAGDIPDNQVFVRYRPPHAAYSVEVPEGWARRAAGGAVTFTDKLNAIRMESRRAGAAPTVTSARAADVPRLARTVRGFRLRGVTTVTRRPGQALMITYSDAAPKNPVTGTAGVDSVERYAYFRAGDEVVLTLSGPKGADNVDPWRIVTDSLRWEG